MLTIVALAALLAGGQQPLDERGGPTDGDTNSIVCPTGEHNPNYPTVLQIDRLPLAPGQAGLSIIISRGPCSSIVLRYPAGIHGTLWAARRSTETQ
jgi:hypothetical protein